MSAYIVWFLLALAMLAAEMVTGTFYLLVTAAAFATGGLVALMDWPLSAQIITGSVVGVIGTLVLRRSKISHPKPDENQNLDIGQPVRIMHWRENGTLRVAYRGAEWDAELVSTDTPRDQTLYIQSTRGSVLILGHNKPHH